MQDKIQEFWEKALASYGAKDWIDKPTIFVEQAVQYFPKNGKILELAAGQGQDSRFLAKKNFEVTCTDRSDFGLEAAAEKSKKDNLNLTFKKVDFSKTLPFPDGTFDVVYSHLGLHYFTKENTRRLFLEIQRVLKPQGIIAALFNSTDDPEISGDGFEKIEDNYYFEVKTGLQKRYFTLEDTQYFTEGLFEPIILDDLGRAYKDGKTALIRLVARKIGQ
ncbi:MAG: hypothetical protein UT48_C0018G0005 [Parcubacteria group bacterium GW2011_GWE2_39_37]|uniref:Methyltransferase domain-containing protein n=1 Tax=Candidatus Falkowbacteria bacterium GW2011_GWF2_39_8 TaxID=1618642 RepID=A0A0G0SFM1_9BACT|nr:MAG: hypothetical protein UT48_C0018G0005 [Parcubacteria group bacterium GW2011_GWE2_39_37]KKR33505.1 MAG: hypothetical protein UT64_C0007G0007 [Candidatus Falkowbacteria bacterium GW2011_GWF2_39_8]